MLISDKAVIEGSHTPKAEQLIMTVTEVVPIVLAMPAEAGP
jgi:hypothetical protein